MTLGERAAQSFWILHQSHLPCNNLESLPCDKGWRIGNFVLFQELRTPSERLRLVEAGIIALVVNNKGWDPKIQRSDESHVMPLNVAIHM